MKSIMENGVEREVTDEQADRLIALDLIYQCDCDDQVAPGHFHHLNTGDHDFDDAATWRLVEQALGEGE